MPNNSKFVQITAIVTQRNVEYLKKQAAQTGTSPSAYLNSIIDIDRNWCEVEKERTEERA